jgi:SAM-dependent methyltransferase
MYDQFSSDYDRFVSWPGRLAFELPFITRQIPAGARVLDAACGTGMHAIALAQKGYRSAGADLSPRMIARASENASNAGVEVTFKAAGFGELSRAFGEGAFDAVLCLGNSLPHLTTPAHLAAALADFAACLRPGGLLLLQNRNFDAVMTTQQRWMEPQAHRESAPWNGDAPQGGAPQSGEEEWLFLRFYDFTPDGLIQFNIVTLKRSDGGPWAQSVVSTPLYPLGQEELVNALVQNGFEAIALYGGMDGEPFDPTASGNLVVTARR